MKFSTKDDVLEFINNSKDFLNDVARQSGKELDVVDASVLIDAEPMDDIQAAKKCAEIDDQLEHVFADMLAVLFGQSRKLLDTVLEVYSTKGDEAAEKAAEAFASTQEQFSQIIKAFDQMQTFVQLIGNLNTHVDNFIESSSEEVDKNIALYIAHQVLSGEADDIEQAIDNVVEKAERHMGTEFSKGLRSSMGEARRMAQKIINEGK